MTEETVTTQEDSPVTIDEISASVIHKTDGTVVEQGFGQLRKLKSGERFTFIRPGGVMIDRDGDVLTVREWPVDYKPGPTEIFGS